MIKNSSLSFLTGVTGSLGLLATLSCATSGTATDPPEPSPESTATADTGTGFRCGNYGEIVSTPPGDLPFLTGRAESGCFSWQTLAALSFPVRRGERPVTNGDEGPTLWESWLTPDKLFPPARDPCNHPLTLSMSTGISHEIKDEVLGDVPDAGCLDFVLIDQQGDSVWHEVHLDPIYANFVRVNRHHELEPRGGDDFQFPDGAIAVKSSWKPAHQVSDASRYYVREVRRFHPESGCSQPERMALVGLHLIKKTETFPSWIWATFEHVDNAPSKALTDQLARDWTFYNSAFADQPEAWNKPCLKGSPDCRPTELVRLERPSVDAEQVNQHWQSVFPEESVWHHYMLVGTQWQHGATPEGDRRLANTTMETACQDRQNGCVGCHGQSSHDFSFAIQHAPDR